MIKDSELIKNETYRVKVVDTKSRFYNGKVIVKWTGILFRSIKTDNALYLNQIEVQEKVESETKNNEVKQENLFGK